MITMPVPVKKLNTETVASRIRKIMWIILNKTSEFEFLGPGIMLYKNELPNGILLHFYWIKHYSNKIIFMLTHNILDVNVLDEIVEMSLTPLNDWYIISYNANENLVKIYSFKNTNILSRNILVDELLGGSSVLTKITKKKYYSRKRI